VFPNAFAYHRPHSLEEALELLAEHGDDAKVLAGGQSLLPLMKLRLAVPEMLVDIGRLAELQGIDDQGDTILIRAATRYQAVVDDPVLAARCPLLPAVVRRVGDPQVRHRGTFGGGIAHGDAAGDLPATILALEAVAELRSVRGSRQIPVSELFLSYLETAIEPDEILTGLRVPLPDGDWRYAHEKFSRVSHAWAVVGSCAAVRIDDGRIADVRIGLTNVAPVPLRAQATEEALLGAHASPENLGAAALLADEGTDPSEDRNASRDYRRHLTRILTERALQRTVV
jgi:aerobic carbon-monoxide dehydrogenase medium subunit